MSSKEGTNIKESWWHASQYFSSIDCSPYGMDFSSPYNLYRYKNRAQKSGTIFKANNCCTKSVQIVRNFPESGTIFEGIYCCRTGRIKIGHNFQGSWHKFRGGVVARFFSIYSYLRLEMAAVNSFISEFLIKD